MASLRTLFCAYRAHSQALVHDEAYSFLKYLNGPWSDVWTPLFDANNHVLATFLTRLSISVFGVSEFSLRLPSVAAGFLMTIGFFRVLQSCRSPWVRWISLVALSLHPLLLDFSVAARGYGLGIAALAWALYYALQRRHVYTGLLLGLGIAANLTILFPALALSCATGLLSPPRSRLRSALAILLPALTVAGAICGFPMRNAALWHFYVGTETITDSLFDLTLSSFRNPALPGPLLGSIDASRMVAKYGIPLAVTVFLACIFFVWRRWQEAPRSVLAVPLALVLAAIGQIAAHGFFDAKYPVDRTGLYLIVMAGLSWATLADLARSRLSRILMLLPTAFLLIQFLTQVQTTSFRVWPFNAATRAVALRLKEQCEDKAPESLTLSADVSDAPSLEFYRIHLPIPCLQPVERNLTQPLSDHDFYLFNSLSPEMVRPVEVLYLDLTYGSRLARDR